MSTDNLDASVFLDKQEPDYSESCKKRGLEARLDLGYTMAGIMCGDCPIYYTPSFTNCYWFKRKDCFSERYKGCCLKNPFIDP
jgi:hypothetical protein